MAFRYFIHYFLALETLLLIGVHNVGEMRLFVFNQSLATYCSLRRFASENDRNESEPVMPKVRANSVQSLNTSKIFRREPIHKSCGRYQPRRTKNQRSYTAFGDQLFPVDCLPLCDHSIYSRKPTEPYWRRMSCSLDELDIKTKLSDSIECLSTTHSTYDTVTNGTGQYDNRRVSKDSILVHFLAPNSIDTESSHDHTFEKVSVCDNLTVDRVLQSVLEARGLSSNDVEVYLEGSQTPLPIFQSPSFCLGGRKLFLKAKNPSKMSTCPVRTQSQQDAPSRKTSLQSTTSNVRKNSFMLNRSSKQKQLQLLQSNAGGSSNPSSTNTTPGDEVEEGQEPEKEGTKRTKSSMSRKSIFFSGVKDRSMINRLQIYCDSTEHPSTSNQYQAIMSTLEIEDSWKNLVLEPDVLTGRQLDHQEAIWELVQTEEKYLRLLSLLTNIKGYLTALQGDGYLLDIEPSMLLRNIDDVLKANLHFWIKGIYPVLQEARHTGRPLDVEGLSLAFSEMDRWFQPYIHFCIDHIQMLYYIEKKKKENENFRDFVEFIQGLEALNRLHLKDLLAVPMQRLTKYPLLLKAILKKTDCSVAQQSLKTMIEAAEEAASRVNVEMFVKQQQDVLNDLNRMIEDTCPVDAAFNDEIDKLVKKYTVSFDITSLMPYCKYPMMRRLIHKSDLKMKDAYGFKGEVTCILLTDMFIVCKSARRNDKMRVIRPPYHIERIVVKELTESVSFGFALVYLNEFNVPAAAYSFQTSSHEDTLRWIELFHMARKEFHDCKDSKTATWRRVPSSSNSDWSGSIFGSVGKKESQSKRRISISAMDHQRSMSLCATQEKKMNEAHGQPYTSSVSASSEHTQVVHRKSSSMDSTALSAAATTLASCSSMEDLLTSPKINRTTNITSNYLLPTCDGQQYGNPRKSLPNIICPDEIQPIKTELDEQAQLKGTARPRSNSAEVLSKLLKRPAMFRSRTPSPANRNEKIKECVDQNGLPPSTFLHAQLSSRGSLATDSDDADTLVAEELRDEHIRIPSPVIPESYEEVPAVSINDSESVSKEPDVYTNGDSEAEHRPNHGRRYERRYYTADAIDVFKPKQAPAGILKRFSWNISGAMSGARPSTKKGSQIVGKTNEWRKGNSAMSSDSFCSSSGVSSSSSQLCVSEETEEETVVPSALSKDIESNCVHISRVCIESNNTCPLADSEEDTVLASPANIQIEEKIRNRPLKYPAVNLRMPSEDLLVVVQDDDDQSNQPSRQQLLRLILEGGLETS